MIKKGWGLNKQLEIHEMPGKNAFLFRFVYKDDYYRVLKIHLWSIQGALLNLQKWDDYSILSEAEFRWFLIQIKNQSRWPSAMNASKITAITVEESAMMHGTASSLPSARRMSLIMIVLVRNDK
ncbi:hypothetical protein K1719_012128 [Acacia pycnantha]|nr:hypothetical protein K1719_012128 [Acacia pycnantha]